MTSNLSNEPLQVGSRVRSPLRDGQDGSVYRLFRDSSTGASRMSVVFDDGIVLKDVATDVVERGSWQILDGRDTDAMIAARLAHAAVVRVVAEEAAGTLVFLSA